MYPLHLSISLKSFVSVFLGGKETHKCKLAPLYFGFPLDLASSFQALFFIVFFTGGSFFNALFEAQSK